MFLVLIIRHEKRMRHILSSVMAYTIVLYFSTLSHNRHEFGKKNIVEHKICVLIFSTTFSGTFRTVRGIQQDIAINVRRSSCKAPVILLGFKRELNLLDILLKPTQKYQTSRRYMQWQPS